MSEELDFPVCECIRPIIKKYVSIRNKSLAEDETVNPGKPWPIIDHKKTKEAMQQNASKYLIELLEAKHSYQCPAYQEILSYVEMSRQKLWSDKRRLPKSVFDFEVNQREKEWQKQANKWEARIMKCTATLNEISAQAYWIYLNSVEHLHMYEWEKGNPTNEMGFGVGTNNRKFLLFKDKEYSFPYSTLNLLRQLQSLKKILKEDNLGATDLQELPSRFFEKSELKDYPEHAKLVYNIIEEITLWYADRYHNGRKDRVINNFLKHCEEKALQVRAKEEAPAATVKEKLTIDKIALYHAYMGMQITRANGNEIAASYGHKSGEKLFQQFTYFSSTANRKGRPVPCTPKRLENKIRLLQSVADMLPDATKRRALDEIEILKAIQREEY